MTRTLFFWWTKPKICWSSYLFPYKGSKTNAGFYHFKEICEINFCYFFLIRHTQHFYLLDHCFSGHRLPPPLVCQHALFIYCAKYVNTYTGKSFCWTREGGGWYAIKLFLISIYFLVTKRVSAQNKVPVTVRMENWFHYHKVLNTRKLFCENSNIW